MDVFGGAPRFLAYPRPVVVQTGTDGVLKCQIGGDPRPAVIWERNNEQIHPEGRYRVFEDGNVYNLIITGVNSEDSGQYICKAKNCIGETYAAATLKVEGEAQELELREENKPRFLIKPLSTRVARGEDAVFSCKLWGNPRPEVVWEKDGRKLNEIFESTHFSVGYQEGGWFQLKIFKTRAPDGGVYTCKARNEFGEGLAGAVLLVDAGPGHDDDGNRNGYTNGHWKSHQGKQRSGRQVTSRLKDDPLPNSTKVKMFAVTEGKHAKFRCYVTGKPKPEIIWRKDGRLILSGRRYLLYEDREGYFTLKVLYCKQQDNGVYVCAASNSAGQTLSAVHLSVKEPPVRFKQPLCDLQVWERDLAILECEVPEDSVPITWYLEDRRLQPGAKYGMEEWGTKRRLTIRDIGVDDDGIYLCEMPDGGRSIAEVAVKGTIVRKLPRKVDVLEGENAAFCVEVEEEEMDIHWYKDGVELRETHQTILKSFGRTHILVFVNTTPQDSGLVIFYVGRSKTSSQLRVKAVRHCPPSCPVGVQINTERANAALLSWVPAPDSRKNPPSGYVLERQEVGSQEWLQCLTTDSATSVEILGDSVPCEADYRFRICSVNKYGRSGNVEFPRAVHLVPVARIQAPLQDALVPEGQDACFTIELSASVIGTWFLNGTQLQEDDRFSMRRTRTHQTLRIRGVRDTDNGAEITFIAYGIRDSAALYIQAPLVKFTTLSEMDRNKFVEVGNPIVLYCELSDPEAPVHWYKNGVELHSGEGLAIQSEGTMRRIVIQSAEFSHSGVYSCDAIDDVIRFNVEVEAPPARFSLLPDSERSKSIEVGRPIVLQCELSDPTAQVYWYKDGTKLQQQSGLSIQTDGNKRTLVVQSAEFCHSGIYSCKAKGDAVQFNVDVKAPPVRFSAIPEAERRKSIEAGCSFMLQCELSDPTGNVLWHKDGTQLSVKSGLAFQSKDSLRTLHIESTELSDSGMYSCATKDDAIEFHVEIRAKPLRFAAVSEDEKSKCVEAGCPFQLQCELSEPSGTVCWYKDGKELLPEMGLDAQADGTMRRLAVLSAEMCHAGKYSCKTSDDSVHFTVEIKAPSMENTTPSEVERQISNEAENSVVEGNDTGRPTAEVVLCRDELRDEPDVLQQDTVEMQSLGTVEEMVVVPSMVFHREEVVCETPERTEQSHEDVKDTQVTIAAVPEIERNKSTDAGCPVQLQCEVSDPSSPVFWYKDGTELHPENGLIIQSETPTRRLITPSPQQSHTGVYSCKTVDDIILYKVDVKAPPPIFSAIPEAEKNKSIEAGSPIVLRCEISDPTTEVCWYKDGVRLHPQSGNAILSEGTLRTLVVHAAGPCHGGVYTCETKDTALQFAVDIKAPPVKFCAIPEDKQNRCIEAGCPFELECEISNPAAHVTWYKDRRELEPQGEIETLSEGAKRKLSVPAAEVHHTGIYTCKTADDAIRFIVDVKVPSPRFIPLPEVERNKSVTVGQPIVLKCGISDHNAEVSWYKDGEQLSGKHGVTMETEGNERKLIVASASLSDSGQYSCAVADDAVSFMVDVQAVPVRFSALPDVARNKFVEAGCPIVLQCELSDPTAQVSWFKDGNQVLPIVCLDILSEGSFRTLIIQSAELSHSGAYTCHSEDDRIAFKVDVAASPVRFSAAPEVEKSKSIEAGRPIVLHCEITDPTAMVQWYKDGEPLLPQSGIYIQSNDTTRTLVIQSAEFTRSGLYTCKTADDISEFYVDVKAPPVTFVYVPEEDLHKNIVEQECLTLSCEVSRADAMTQWYKDGVEVQPDDKSSLQTEGTVRKLTIQASQLSDSGTYTCRAGDSVLMFKVNVREPPVKIVFPKEDVHLDRHVPEEIVLSCELSRPNASVTWFKDGQKLQESENIKLKTEGPYRRLKILRSGVEDSGEYVCDTADDRIFFQLNITEPPVRIVSPSQSQMELCQQTAERMVLSCEISRANAVVRWYRDGLEVEENDNLILEVDGVYRRLIIPETTVKDSAEYVCDTGDDSVTFFVNIAEPPVRFIRPRKMACGVDVFVGDPILLDCEVSRANAEVTWKKNGEEIEESTKVTIFEDGLIRQLSILSATLEDAGQYMCDAKDDVMDFHVSVTEPPVKILRKDEIVTERHIVAPDDIVLKCELSCSDGTVDWYKDNERVVESERLSCEAEGAFRTLVILNAEIADAGEYICDAKDDKVQFSVTVEEAPVTILGNSEHPEHHSLVAGDDLILECEVSRSNAPVEWYCNGRLLNPDSRTHIESRETVRKLVLTCLELSDAGEYMCDAADDKMIILVRVQEPPTKFLNTEEENKIVTSENDKVTLCAKVNKERAKVHWLKDKEPLMGSRFKTSTEGKNHYLVIDPVKKSDCGRFVCDASTDEMDFTVLVKELKVKFSKPLENAIGLKDNDLVLRCELYKPRGDVQWLRDNQEITPSHHFTIRANGCERSLTIHNVTLEDAGVYTCESKDERTCATVEVQKPRIVEFIAELHNITLMEGEDATFRCVLSPEDVKLEWCMNGKPIVADEKFTMSSSGLSHTLHIHNCQVGDTSRVTAEAEGVVSKASLRVQEAQVVFTKNMEDVVSEEFGEATLEVEVSLDSGEVQWMRHGLVIQVGPKFTLKQIDRKRSLTIHKLVLSDRGTYSCETLHDRTQANLSVEPRKIKICKGLSEIQTFERETASFEVELSHNNVEAVWQKEGTRLKSSSRWRMSSKGRVHGLTISNLTLEDTGTYSLSAENARSSARLTVKETPVTLLKKLEDVRFPEASVVTMECELSRHNVEVKWTKDGVELKPGKNHRIYSMGRKRFLQILRCEMDDSGVYMCDAGDTSTSCSLEVYEPELEVIQSLEDLEIQEDENAVFMCELSLDNIPGEWFKNGEKIKPTSTIRIRQEGTKHFLLICNIKGEDSGEIKFVAKNIESTAYLEVEELPVNIVQPLQDKTALEKSRALLDCTVSNPRCSIRWYKGSNVVLPSERFEICSEGCYRKLVIQQVALEDEGTYSVQVGDYSCSAKLTVEAQSLLMVRELQDVEVAAPDEACFECEVSMPVTKAPVWTLNGESLQAGPRVLLEKMGTVHKLTLRQTSADMTGPVQFTSGKAKSTANLVVKSNL
ncbi:obscurin [Alosa pseudoharengus]|uniref:obscurin n=1 Tax=Alosa pseudoharengus TaxID=34774 RepID=UPI003F8910A9